MKKYLLAVLLLATFQSFGQFLNYTNINGRYKWIAGKFDSTFTLPSGPTPSLRTGGGNAPGALFYSTTDSVVYEYTGSQWRPLHGSDTSKVQIAYVRNTSGSSMTTGQVVYINGSTGTTPTIALANNKNDSSSAVTFGIVRGNIANNAFGWITTFGPIEGINTNAYTEGESIYLDSISGQFTHDKPVAPYHMVVIGYVIKKAANGIVFAKIQNGYELDELHNVKITGPVLNKSVLVYDSIKALWVDSTVSAAGLGLGGSGTTNYVSKWTSSTALGNSQIFDNGTNVGIGTNSPISYSAFTGLSISGTNGAVLDLMYGSTVGGELAASSVLFAIKTLGATPLTFQTNSSEKMRLTSAGRLLIGTTTESTYELDVVGDIRSTLDANINGLTVGRGNGSVATNIVFGSENFNASATGGFNIAIGVQSLSPLTSGEKNVSAGYQSGLLISTGSRNTLLGYFSSRNKNGSDNTFIGHYSGSTGSAGSNITAVGNYAAYQTTGNYNNLFGNNSGFDLTTGQYNTMVGSGTAGNGITTGSYNTIIGSNVTGLSTSLASHTIIADGQGNMRLVAFNDGNVYIGGSTTLPTNSGYKLDVNGTARVSGMTTMATSTANTESLVITNSATGGSPYLKLGVWATFGHTFSSQYTIIGNNCYPTSDGTSGWTRINAAKNASFININYDNIVFGSSINAASGSLGTGGMYLVSNSLGIGTATPNASALLDVSSTTKGILFPRMTNAQMVAISTPAAGLVVYDTTNNKLNVYDGTNWVTLH